MKPKYEIGDKVIYDSTVCFVTDYKYYESDQKCLYFITAIKGRHINKIIDEKYLKSYNIKSQTYKEWNLPEGYIFKDENGNIISATKIIVEKKKKEYPKTYKECCEILEIDANNFITIRNIHCRDGEEEVKNYEYELLNKFDYLWELIICRDAYWKIAGEEMGLGKPWKPDWNAKDNHFYTIYIFNGEITCSETGHRNAVLIFPTPEIRDSFKESEDISKLIEECKELL